MSVSKKDQKKFKRDFNVLITLAKNSDKKLSDRYAYIASNMITSKKVKLNQEEKFLICKKCNRLLIPGRNCNVRLIKGFLTYKCLNCGSIKKVKYDKRI